MQNISIFVHSDVKWIPDNPLSFLQKKCKETDIHSYTTREAFI